MTSATRSKKQKKDDVSVATASRSNKVCTTDCKTSFIGDPRSLVQHTHGDTSQTTYSTVNGMLHLFRGMTETTTTHAWKKRTPDKQDIAFDQNLLSGNGRRAPRFHCNYVFCNSIFPDDAIIRFTSPPPSRMPVGHLGGGISSQQVSI